MTTKPTLALRHSAIAAALLLAGSSACAQTAIEAELAVEHSVSSASDRGEVEVEQAYIEHQIDPRWAVRGGLFLMPVGLLNENHEPTAYYGVERNFVETAIIPTTWREGGVQFVGSF